MQWEMIPSVSVVKVVQIEKQLHLFLKRDFQRLKR